MMNIVWSRPDGGVSVTHLVPQEVSSTPVPADSQAHSIELKERGDIPADWNAMAFDVAVPSDRTFRSAWVFNSGLTVDMTRARVIHRQRLSLMKAQKLDRLNEQIFQAIEDQDIVRRAQLRSLRDALFEEAVTRHPAIDTALTPEQLRDAIPDSLK